MEKGSEPEVKVEDSEDNIDQDPDLVLQQQWQLNLLDHIEAVQDEVTHHMDLIERELDGKSPNSSLNNSPLELN